MSTETGRPYTDVTAELMDAEEEPADLIHFNRNGERIDRDGHRIDRRGKRIAALGLDELHQLVADEMAATHGGTSEAIASAIHRVDKAARKSRAAGVLTGNVLEGLLMQFNLAEMRERGQ